MQHSSTDLDSLTGVARALIHTVGVDETVMILTTEFGWDTAFLALAGVGDADACHALWAALDLLTFGELSNR